VPRLRAPAAAAKRFHCQGYAVDAVRQASGQRATRIRTSELPPPVLGAAIEKPESRRLRAK
jgi:hypothetical protein